MKKLIIIGILALVLLSISAVAEPTVLDTINYKETKMIALGGDVTLTLNQSTTAITLVFRLYDPISNITAYNVRSEEIIYDSTFINNTKNFSFVDSHANDYIIRINYSSIQVPPTLQEIIAGYVAIIENLSATNNITLVELERVYGLLNASYVEINNTLLLVEEEKAKYQPLLDQLINYSAEIENLKMNISAINNEKYRIEQLYLQYKDPWCLFAAEGIYFNYSTAVIIIIILGIVGLFFWSKKTGKPIPGFEQAKTLIFKQKPKKNYKEPEGSDIDLEILKEAKQ